MADSSSVTSVGNSLSGAEFRGMDPISLTKLVYKKVEICSAEENRYEGWIYTVDPVSLSIILADCDDIPPDGQIPLTVVIGQSISSLTVVEEDTARHKDLLDRLFKDNSQAKRLSRPELRSKKQKVKDWLELHRVPVKECGDNNDSLSISDVLVIEPPYEDDNCLCKNEIILARVQALIRNMKDANT